MKIKRIIFFTISALILSLATTGCDAGVNSSTTTTTINNAATTTTTVFLKSMNEKCLEAVDASGNTLNYKTYDSSNKLVEYGVYYYDGNGKNTEVKLYSSDTTSDTNYTGKYFYTYGSGDNSWDVVKSQLFDKNGNVIQYFDATYNDKHMYLTCILYDKDGKVIENRVSTYDGDGVNYLTETYYSALETVDNNIIDKYVCSYDPAIKGRYLQEIKYHKVSYDPTDASKDSMSYNSYETTTVYCFLWAKDTSKTHYLQQSYDQSGDLLDMIQYRFNSNGNKISRSFFSEGKLQNFRTYAWDEDNSYIADESNYDKSDTIIGKETCRWFQDTNGNWFKETASYTYGYATSSSKSIADSLGSSKNKLNPPKNNRKYSD